jgi:hypothetical protein
MSGAIPLPSLHFMALERDWQTVNLYVAALKEHHWVTISLNIQYPSDSAEKLRLHACGILLCPVGCWAVPSWVMAVPSWVMAVPSWVMAVSSWVMDCAQLGDGCAQLGYGCAQLGDGLCPVGWWLCPVGWWLLRTSRHSSGPNTSHTNHSITHTHSAEEVNTRGSQKIRFPILLPPNNLT